MSLLSSVLKGKGVQTAFCSLCSANAAPSRAVSSNANPRGEISQEAFRSNISRGEAVLRDEVQRRRGNLNQLVGVFGKEAERGPAPGSVIAQKQGEATSRTEDGRNEVDRTAD